MTSTCKELLIDFPTDYVMRITLNRPEARNALSTHLLAELANTLEVADRDDEVRCVIITGGDKVFAAGADIREMAGKTAVEALTDTRPTYWKAINEFTKPLVAAVNGYCLGGGNELAMACDIIVAGQDARFGQPEIKLGMIPGAGGTQRLTWAVGKAKAMKTILSGELMDAGEAFAAGLISEISQNTQERVLELAKLIAKKSPIALRLAKEAVRQASEGALIAGIALERKSSALLFATEDRREGIAAFLEKREPQFTGR